MKRKLTLLMLGLAMSVAGFAGTETTVYLAISTEYDMRLNIQKETSNGDSWEQLNMVKTDKTYNGLAIYSCSFTDWFNGVANMQFQAYDGETQKWSDGVITSWESVTTYNGKIFYQPDRKWMDYAYDKPITIHCPTTIFTPTNAYVWYKVGETDYPKTGWPGDAVSTNSLNASYRDYTINYVCYDKIIFFGDSKQTVDLNIDRSADEYWVTMDGTQTESKYNASVTPICPASFNYTRDVTIGNFGTICLPYNATVTGATVFKIVSKIMDGENLKGINLESVDELEAGKAYIFKATESTLTATLSSTYTEAISANAMLGNLSSATTHVPLNDYVVSGNQIHKVSAADGVTVGQYKAYITASGLDGLSASARGNFFIGFDDEATGIKNLNAVAEDNAVYNLQGQRVKIAQKGIFIVNGKKVIRK